MNTISSLNNDKNKFEPYSLSFIPKYRPYIKYNWSTTFDDIGNRQLINAGENNINYKATMYSGRGIKQNGINQTISVSINDTINTVVFFKNDELVFDEILQTITDYATDVNSSDTYQNFIFYKGVFENYEKEYLRTNPEKFLYHEKQVDGTFVAKSEILSQEKIDNVVAHFPMCETDGYVRNMIRYSEGDIKSVYMGSVSDDNTKTIISGNKVKYKITVAQSNVYTPQVIYMGEYVENELYRTKIILEVLSGTVKVQGGDGSDSSAKLPITTYDVGTYIVNGVTPLTSNGRFGINIDTTDYHSCEFTIELTAQRLTATYPIENYTTSCNATNLSTGLQTCFWKRDVLGVPVGSSFDVLSFDGNSYVDTRWIPPADGYYALALVMKSNTFSTAYNIMGSSSSGGDSRVIVGFSPYSSTPYIYARIGSKNIQFQHLINTNIFLILEYDNGVFRLRNGCKTIFKQSVDYVAPAAPFGLGATLTDNTGGIRPQEIFRDAEISFFSVHTKPYNGFDDFQRILEKSFKDTKTKIFAHRGFADYMPENTMYAFKNAVKLGADGIEMDVQISKDGIPVVIHDTSTERVGTKSVTVSETTLKELQSIDVGSKAFGADYSDAYIPTFQEVVEYLSNYDVTIYWEIKGYRTQSDIDLMLDVMNNAGVTSQSKIQGFSTDDLAYTRKANPEVTLVYLTNGLDEERFNLAKADGNAELAVPVQNLFNDDNFGIYLKRCKDNNVPIAAWLIDDSSTAYTCSESSAYAGITNRIPTIPNIKD